MAKQLIKRQFTEFSRAVFGTIKKNRAYQWISKSHFLVRWILGIPILLFGILAWFTPIPGGFLLLLFAGVILFPLKSFRSWFRRITHRSRVLSLYEKWFLWRHARKNPKKYFDKP